MTATSELTLAIDHLLGESYQPSEPGASVIVVKAGQVLYRHAIGMAQLELGVPLSADMVFRLGSITKQITAVAILMLQEQGRLALSDPMTKFLPEYPTHGHTITIEHLLTHTSGIRSYTNMPEWLAIWRKDLSVTELTNLFKDQPLEFAPGTRWAYNNSGYHLLGAIIEQISGQSYEQFLQQQIFTPLGMQQTAYDHSLPIIPGRVAGYAKGPDGYSNAEYLSMTQPYAAGALISTVDDLATWDRALTDNTLLRAETLQQAWKSYQLADGTSTSYGYGWSLSEWQGRPTIEHGGGIHGFSTYGLRMPAEQLYIAILTNLGNGPILELLALRIAALVLGEPYSAPTPIALENAELQAVVGTYQLPNEQQWQIVLEDGQLFGQRSDWPRRRLVPTSQNDFYVAEMPLNRIVFSRNDSGTITAIAVYGRTGLAETAQRADGS